MNTSEHVSFFKFYINTNRTTKPFFISLLCRSNFDLWERSNIIVSCCEQFSIIKMTFKDIEVEKTFINQVLPHPPLQNSVLIPSNWELQETKNNEIG